MAGVWLVIILVISLALLVSARGENGSTGRVFSFETIHRYSDAFDDWSSPPWAEATNPRGSFEYYAEMAHRDLVFLARRRRKLSSSSPPLSFSGGNSTFRITSLGFLHYTKVELGTPGVKFMVALDTGSDLFWVPCNCTRCAPTDQGASYAADFQLSIYNPKGSSTSRKVSCNNDLCTFRNRCVGTFSSSCPYTVSYMSADTSTSGILVEDVLHLTTEDDRKELIQAYVTFGCGQVQSGSFLDIAAPNGLFGLGMEKISVPSILSREGLIADSFSMCFGHDGVGRIRFGDKGSPDQDETPFNSNPSHPSYNITVTRVRVGTALIDVEFTALFDSGTSFTYLVEPAYERVTEHFHQQARDLRRPPDSRIPFEYCYDMSPAENGGVIPSLTLTMKGGSQLAVYDPIIIISTQSELVYCLAMVKSSELNIIGQNFMTGYRVVFDREELVMGWKKLDCNEGDNPNASAVQPHVAPDAPAAGSRNASSSHQEDMDDHSRGSAGSPRYLIPDLLLSSLVFSLTLCFALAPLKITP